MIYRMSCPGRHILARPRWHGNRSIEGVQHTMTLDNTKSPDNERQTQSRRQDDTGIAREGKRMLEGKRRGAASLAELKSKLCQSTSLPRSWASAGAERTKDYVTARYPLPLESGAALLSPALLSQPGCRILGRGRARHRLTSTNVTPAHECNARSLN